MFDTLEMFADFYPTAALNGSASIYDHLCAAFNWFNLFRKLLDAFSLSKGFSEKL